jgi:formylglycine-generating enzyme required for sulfatase activity
MDQIIHRILRFDRFALDQMRGSVRAGDQDIHLRPKAFEVLSYLAEHAGQLVPKHEFYEAMWSNVTVSDGSLVQCIRELRQKLGDDDHRLIKTVSRRGYLLDATVSAEAPQTPSRDLAKKPAVGLQETTTAPGVLDRVRRTIIDHKLSLWGAVVLGVVCLGLAAMYLRDWPASVANLGHVSFAATTPVALHPRPSFKDCEICPEMIALPAGDFMMGSPESEGGHQKAEGLPRRVVIAQRIAIARFEVTVDQFAAFVADTGVTAGNTCRMIIGFDGNAAIWGPPQASFRQPGFEITGSHPVVCISWHDAQAYVAWLRRRTGKPYRLPTEAEWEYAARAGMSTAYSFGDDATAVCAYARFADLGSGLEWGSTCRSETATYGPIPVGQLKPNAWGIFDMLGNAWEWVEDCWTPNAAEIPTDGSAFSHLGKCETGVIRGGSWAAGARKLRSAARSPQRVTVHNHNFGFRVALSLGPSQ